VSRAPKKPPDQLSVLTKLNAFKAEYDELMARRDLLVIEAWDAGLSVHVIAAMVGINPSRIYQIKDGR